MAKLLCLKGLNGVGGFTWFYNRFGTVLAILWSSLTFCIYCGMVIAVMQCSCRLMYLLCEVTWGKVLAGAISMPCKWHGTCLPCKSSAVMIGSLWYSSCLPCNVYAKVFGTVIAV